MVDDLRDKLRDWGWARIMCLRLKALAKWPAMRICVKLENCTLAMEVKMSELAARPGKDFAQILIELKPG